jgi:hypothetical protein
MRVHCHFSEEKTQTNCRRNKRDNDKKNLDASENRIGRRWRSGAYLKKHEVTSGLEPEVGAKMRRIYCQTMADYTDISRPLCHRALQVH